MTNLNLSGLEAKPSVRAIAPDWHHVVAIVGLLVIAGYVNVSRYVQRKHFEALTANVRAIADSNRTEFTQIGKKLAAGLEQCQVQDVYPMLGGRTEITRANLTSVQSRVHTALRLLAESSSQSQFRLEQMKRDALTTSRRDVANGFNTGVDRAASELQGIFTRRKNFYERLDDVLRFLSLRFGEYRANGEKLLFVKKGDSAKFEALLDRLYSARKVWEP